MCNTFSLTEIRMPTIKIPAAKLEEAENLKSLSITAFEENFKKYGHYPPGLASVDWHKEKIENGLYHTIRYGEVMVGGVYLISYPNNQMKIEYLFIRPKYQGKQIGTKVMSLIENEYNMVTTWFLLTPHEDYRNHYFYEKLGYKKVGEIKPIEKSDFTLFKFIKTTNP